MTSGRRRSSGRPAARPLSARAPDRFAAVFEPTDESCDRFRSGTLGDVFLASALDNVVTDEMDVSSRNDGQGSEITWQVWVQARR